MKQTLPIFWFLVFLLSTATRGQNLVPNPDFERVKRMPYGQQRGIDCSMSWLSPTFSGSDYFHASSNKDAGTPHNAYGNQEPHSGMAYAGICITKDYIEYIAARLTDTLISGQQYQVELYISRANKSLTSVKEFGVHFSDRGKWSMDQKGIKEKPSVEFIDKGGFKTKDGWIKLSAIYEAEGNETYMIIGHFTGNTNDDYNLFCHYYIDDVSVTPVKNKIEETAEEDRETPAIVEEENTSADPTPETFVPEPNETITLKNVFFDSNKSELLPRSYKELDELARYLRKETATTIRISGHTDNTGDENRNLLLSKERAKAVADYLETKGIAKKRIQYEGFGNSKPLVPNEGEQGKQQNRRVEFVISAN